MKLTTSIILGWLLVLSHSATLMAGTIPKYLEAFLQKAEQGDAQAQAAVGTNYLGTWMVPRDDAQAIYWLKKAAAQDNASAQYGLGIIYEEGRSVPKDNLQAIEWYRKAAEQGFMAARTHLRTLFVTGQLVPEVDDHMGAWWQKLAEQSQAEKKGFAHLQNAAHDGTPVDQINLGIAYLQGIGTARDRKQAATLFQLAANQGSIEAMCLLSVIKAADKDWIDPMLNAQEIETCQNASNAGYARAQVILAKLYLMERGVPKGHPEAVFWFRKAAEQGEPYAQFMMSYVYENGRGVKIDKTQADFWLQKSAANGNPEALYSVSLGKMFGKNTAEKDEQVIEKNMQENNLAIELQPEKERNFVYRLLSNNIVHSVQMNRP